MDKDVNHWSLKNILSIYEQRDFVAFNNNEADYGEDILYPHDIAMMRMRLYNKQGSFKKAYNALENIDFSNVSNIDQACFKMRSIQLKMLIEQDISECIKKADSILLQFKDNNSDKLNGIYACITIIKNNIYGVPKAEAEKTFSVLKTCADNLIDNGDIELGIDLLCNYISYLEDIEKAKEIAQQIEEICKKYNILHVVSDVWCSVCNKIIADIQNKEDIQRIRNIFASKLSAYTDTVTVIEKQIIDAYYSLYEGNDITSTLEQIITQAETNQYLQACVKLHDKLAILYLSAGQKAQADEHTQKSSELCKDFEYKHDFGSDYINEILNLKLAGKSGDVITYCDNILKQNNISEIIKYSIIHLRAGCYDNLNVHEKAISDIDACYTYYKDINQKKILPTLIAERVHFRSHSKQDKDFKEAIQILENEINLNIKENKIYLSCERKFDLIYIYNARYSQDEIHKRNIEYIKKAENILNDIYNQLDTLLDYHKNKIHVLYLQSQAYHGLINDNFDTGEQLLLQASTLGINKRQNPLVVGCYRMLGVYYFNLANQEKNLIQKKDFILKAEEYLLNAEELYYNSGQNIKAIRCTKHRISNIVNYLHKFGDKNPEILSRIRILYDQAQDYLTLCRQNIIFADSQQTLQAKRDIVTLQSELSEFVMRAEIIFGDNKKLYNHILQAKSRCVIDRVFMLSSQQDKNQDIVSSLNYNTALNFIKNQKRNIYFIDWIVVLNEIYIICLGADGCVRKKKLEYSYKELEENVADLMRPEQITSTLFYNQDDLDYFNDLVLPLKCLTKPDTLLILNPTKILHRLPLHALKCGEQSLLARNPIIYCQTHFLNLNNNHQDTLFYDNKVALFCNPQNNLSATQKFGEQFNKQLLGTKITFGTDVTEEAIKEALETSKIVHFHGHARHNYDDPFESHLYLSEGNLSAKKILNWNMKAQLVILAACESGTARIHAGDEVNGLAQAFIYNGVRTVLSTLWKVNQNSASNMMTKLYERLTSNHSEKNLVDIFREIVLDLSNEYSEIYHWGAFTLSGDWKNIDIIGEN